MRRLPALIPAVLSFLALACDSGNPVAPPAPGPPDPGTTAYTITVTAQPDQLLAGGSEPATLTITVRRVDNGQSPADGTEVTVSVDAGSLGSNDPAAPVALLRLSLAAGAARTTLFPGTAVGTANVLAQVGQSMGRLAVPLLAALPNNFFISGVQPSIGRPTGGDTVAIQGGGFKQPLRVLFGAAAATLLDVPSTATILVQSPPSAMPVPAGTSLAVDVVVQNDLSSPTPLTDTLAGAFFYREDPEPTAPPAFITAVVPSEGTAGGGTAIKVRGGGFRQPLRLAIGGVSAEVTRVRENEISALTPASAMPVAAGSRLAVDVLVESSLDFVPPATATLPGGFTFDGGPPAQPVVVSAIAPTAGTYAGGTAVTVTGSGFTDPVAVELGGVRQRMETFVSPTAVTFTTAPAVIAACPAGGAIAVTGVMVTNLGSGASGSAGLTFTYQLTLPRITSLSRTSGPQGGGFSVTVRGSGFAEPLRVLFARSGLSFAAVNQSVAADAVAVTAPQIPSDVFPEVDCLSDHDSDPMTAAVPGKMYLDAAFDVTVLDQATGCSDTFAGSFTYMPTDPSCRPVPAPP